MRIDNVNIIVRPDLAAALLASLCKAEPQRQATATAAPLTTPPAIGEVWPGQGGIYAGLAGGRDGQPDQHLILAAAVPAEKLSWADAGEWAKKVAADGHTDFSLPSRWESALLYANLQDKVDTVYWYWIGTQYSGGDAWLQGFDHGYQASSAKSWKAFARAVRRFNA